MTKNDRTIWKIRRFLGIADRMKRSNRIEREYYIKHVCYDRSHKNDKSDSCWCRLVVAKSNNGKKWKPCWQPIRDCKFVDDLIPCAWVIKNIHAYEEMNEFTRHAISLMQIEGDTYREAVDKTVKFLKTNKKIPRILFNGKDCVWRHDYKNFDYERSKQ